MFLTCFNIFFKRTNPHAFPPGMAPTEKSPGRLVGKINWRINEVGFNMF